MYQIIWKRASAQNLLGQRKFETVTEATLCAADEMPNKAREFGVVGFDIAWAGSAQPLPEWYRQLCLELGK